MKWNIPLLSLALGLVGAAGPAVAAEPMPLRVLYVGNSRDRAADYEAFLKQHFDKVTVAPRKGFDPAAARDAEVVLLDWPNSELNRLPTGTKLRLTYYNPDVEGEGKDEFPGE